MLQNNYFNEKIPKRRMEITTQKDTNWDSKISKIIWVNEMADLLTHDDIPIFSFAPLDNIRKDLEKIGYSKEEIANTIEGLSELPEYERSQRNQKGRKKN